MITHPLRIGIYGVSGVGKTNLIKELEKHQKSIKVIDGSTVVDQIVNGGVKTFKALDFPAKTAVRIKAVDRLQEIHRSSHKHTVIAGHYCFIDGNNGYDVIWTKADADFYDVIFYLQKPPNAIFAQSQADLSRKRNYSLQQIEAWQEFEKQELTQACNQAGTTLYHLDGQLTLTEIESVFIEQISISVISEVSKEIANSGKSSVVLCDCDGTLNNDDVYNFSEVCSTKVVTNIFKKYPNYCHEAFLDVSNYLDFAVSDLIKQQMFDNARKMLTLHPVMLKKLQAYRNSNAVIVFVSCGFPDVWNSGNFQADFLVGGASFGLHGCLVSDKSKELLAYLLRKYGMQVSAFGNGSLDIGMLKISQKAYYIYADKIKTKHIERLKGHDDLHILKLEGI